MSPLEHMVHRLHGPHSQPQTPLESSPARMKLYLKTPLRTKVSTLIVIHLKHPPEAIVVQGLTGLTKKHLIQLLQAIVVQGLEKLIVIHLKNSPEAIVVQGLEKSTHWNQPPLVQPADVHLHSA